MKIAINNLTKITDTKYSIGYIHWQPFDSVNGLKQTQDQLISAGYKVVDWNGEVGAQLVYDPTTNTVSENIPDPVVTLQSTKDAKVSALSKECQKRILGGFTSKAVDGTTEKTYGSSLEDQSDLQGDAIAALSQLNNTPGCENDKFYIHAQGEEYIQVTAAQCLAISRDFKVFKENLLLKNKALAAYVGTLTTVDDVNKVTFDTVIPISVSTDTTTNTTQSASTTTPTV